MITNLIVSGLQQFEKILARSNPRRILLVKEDFEDMTVHDDNVIFSDFPNEIYIDRFGVVSVTVSIYDIKVTGKKFVQFVTPKSQLCRRIRCIWKW